MSYDEMIINLTVFDKAMNQPRVAAGRYWSQGGGGCT